MNRNNAPRVHHQLSSTTIVLAVRVAKRRAVIPDRCLLSIRIPPDLIGQIDSQAASTPGTIDISLRYGHSYRTHYRYRSFAALRAQRSQCGHASWSARLAVLLSVVLDCGTSSVQDFR